MRKKRYTEEELNEMSFTKDKIEGRLFDSNRIRREHLILIYFLSNDKNVNHWQTEIQAPLMKLSDMKWKNNNKFLSAKDYYNNFWTYPFENADNYNMINKTIEELRIDGYDIPKEWKSSKTDIVKRMKKFYETISALLSQGALSKSRIYALLDELFVNKTFKIY